MPSLLTAVLPLLIAAGAAPAQGAPAEGRTYRAIGTEPFWSLTISRAEIVYDDAEERRLAVRRPRPQTVRGVTWYRTRGMTVAIRNQECSDGMSDRRYADAVRVTMGTRVLNGCGRAYPDARSLDGTEWRIARVNGAAAAGQRPATIAFTETQLSGTTGCNRFSGDYALAAGRLDADRIATTRMACTGSAMETERAILDLLSEPLIAYPMRGGSIRLVGIAGKSADLMPVPTQAD